MNSLLLPAWGLFSKFGFHDGDQVDEWIWDAEDAGQIEQDRFRGVDTHAILRQLVADHLLPLLPGPFTVCHVETNHNPIRVDTWRGEEWDDYANDPPAEVAGISVDIPATAVLAALTYALED